jgi:hypothetical protein
MCWKQYCVNTLYLHMPDRSVQVTKRMLVNSIYVYAEDEVLLGRNSVFISASCPRDLEGTFI